MLQGFFPLKTTGDKDRYNLQHARFLLQSLDRFWEDPDPFPLTVAVPPGELGTVRESLTSLPRVALTIVSETDIVPAMSAQTVSGWYKQMVLKLAFATHASHPFYMTFDADMMCVRPISSRRLLPGGRALTQWEPKRWHPDWWRAAKLFLRIDKPTADVGLSVTPNILSTELTRECLALLARRSDRPPIEFLLANCDSSRLIWTEYSLYSEAAEELGLLDTYHLPWNDARRIGRPATMVAGEIEVLHAECSLWDRAAFATWHPAERLRETARGYFLIFQSSLGIPAEELQARTAAILSA